MSATRQSINPLFNLPFAAAEADGNPRFEPAKHPRPFEYADSSANPRHLPVLSEEDVSDIAAVLKGIARGIYPRLDALPTALNAYNCNRAKLWAYFHDITDVTDARKAGSAERGPNGRFTRRKEGGRIWIDDQVLADLDAPWRFLRPVNIPQQQHNDSLALAPRHATARYRFVCFIHRHRVAAPLRTRAQQRQRQRAAYTISIWDRDDETVTWHDPYPHGRAERRDHIRAFWRRARIPGFVPPLDGGDHEPFVSRIRYRTAYHACARIERTTRGALAPRHSLWAVVAIALHHMNNAHDVHVSIVPDRMELFGGQARALLPQFFAHLLCLCLETARGWDGRERWAFVEQCRIVPRLTWMKDRARKYLEVRLGRVGGKTGRFNDWVFEALNIATDKGHKRNIRLLEGRKKP
ncbi:hypothetical protein F5Y15DRAFT_422320 [Xylariaceae sp. FL0016]|nr:hypothetical protein F5Y15DRAFT_422320 [Xylariaceae sp. FL0016]